MLKQICSFPAHDERVWHLEWSPDGSYLASCGADQKVRLWSFGEKENSNELSVREVGVLDGQHTRTIRRIAWSLDSSYLASASFDSTVSIWQKRSGKFECIATLEGHENEVKCVAWNSTGNLFATCSRDKSVWIWEMESDREFECLAVLQGHTQDVKAVRWHPTEDIIGSCSYDNSIKLWKEEESSEEWECFDTLNSHSSTVWDFFWSQNYLFSCSDDKTIKFWEPINVKGKMKYHNTITLQGDHSRAIYSIDRCPKADPLHSPFSHIVSAGADNVICVYSPVDRTESDGMKAAVRYTRTVKMEQAHQTDINCVRWHPQHKSRFASCSDDGEIKIWHFQSE